MARNDHETIPLWREERLVFPLPSLTADTMADVCVIGAGIAGLTAAYLLAKEGKNVVVLEAWDLTAGETARTTAHLTGILDDRYFELISAFGEEKAQIIAESHMAALNRIEAIIREENIDCEFERCNGYLAAAPEQTGDMEKEAEAVLKAGFADRAVLGAVPLEGVSMQGPVLCVPQQALFNPVKYMRGLAEAFIARGGRIFTDARVTDIRDGVPVSVATESGPKVHAAAAIVATHTPVNDLVAIHTKQAAYRSYVIAFEMPNNAGVPPFLLWDMEQPYHYARLMRGRGGKYLVVGGEDHKTGQGNSITDPYAALEAWTRRHFPAAGAVAHRWSGQIMEPVNGLAFIGRNPGNKSIYIATGFSGNGMTYGTIAGILIRDLIDRRDNHWADVYDPARKSLAATPEYLRENANVLACMIGDWVSRPEVADEADIPPGEGAIMRDGMSKVAAFRDEDGEMHVCSAVCTHLNCVVQWNSGEKTWDCPCHGSRFGTDGQVLNGPAVRALAPRNHADAGLQAPVTELPLGGPFPAGPIITGKDA